MLPAILTILSAQTQEAPLRFQPKVGEKYRFLTTLDEMPGLPAIPAEMDLYMIFKVAGVKDAKFTVHQLIEVTKKGTKEPILEPELKFTYQIDELMKSKVLASPGSGFTPDVSSAISEVIGSAFLMNFSKEFPEVGKEQVEKMDLTKFVQSMFAAIPPEVLFQHTDLDGTRKTTLKSFDARTATFESSLSVKIKVSPPEESGEKPASLLVDTSGTIVVERSTGMPSDYTMKMKIVTTADGKDDTIKMGMHLVRKI